MAAPSPTGAIAAIYDKERPSIEEYVKLFRLIHFQAGGIFMIDGKVVGLDVFGKSGSLIGQIEKFYAIALENIH